VGIALAWRGAGVWALVGQQYGELVVLSASVWILEPWRPGRVSRGENLKLLFTTSSYYSLSTLIIYVAQNLDKVLLPLLLGDAGRGALGLYSQAFSLMMRPVYLVTTPLFSVMLPSLSQVAGDRRQYAELVARFFRLTAIALFPCGIGLWAIAPEAMLVLGGERWRGAGLLLSALAPAILVQGLINLSGTIFASAGRTGRLVAGSFVTLVIVAQALLAGYLFGKLTQPAANSLAPALGMAAAYSTSLVLVLFIPYLLFCVRSVGISLGTVLRPLWPPLRAALVMGLVLAALRPLLDLQPNLPVTARLLILIAVGTGTYVLLARGELGWLKRELSHPPTT